MLFVKGLCVPQYYLGFEFSAWRLGGTLSQIPSCLYQQFACNQCRLRVAS